MTDKFEVVGRAAVTLRGLVLLMKSEDGDWTLPGAFISQEQELDETVEDKVESLTGLDIDIHQVVDAVNVEAEEDVFEIIVHGEARDEELKEVEGIEFEWVDPSQINNYLQGSELEKIKTDRMDNFLEKLKKIPGKPI